MPLHRSRRMPRGTESRGNSGTWSMAHRGSPRVPVGHAGSHPWDTAEDHGCPWGFPWEPWLSVGIPARVRGIPVGNSRNCRLFPWIHLGFRFPRGMVYATNPLWSWVYAMLLDTYTRGNLSLMLERVVGAHGIPWDAPRELPWDPAGNFEGIIAGPHGIPWGLVVFPCDPTGTIGITQGIPWIPVECPTGSRGSSMSSRGLPRNPMGISRVPTGNNTMIYINHY